MKYEQLIAVCTNYADRQVLALVEHLECVASGLVPEAGVMGSDEAATVEQFANDVRTTLCNPDECGE